MNVQHICKLGFFDKLDIFLLTKLVLNFVPVYKMVCLGGGNQQVCPFPSIALFFLSPSFSSLSPSLPLLSTGTVHTPESPGDNPQSSLNFSLILLSQQAPRVSVAQVKSFGQGSRKIWKVALAAWLKSCVMGKSLSFSETRFLHL